MEYEECFGPPCSRLEVDAKFKTKTNTSNSMLSFIYPREIVLIEEFLTDSIISVGWNYCFLASSFGAVGRPIILIFSVAEIGGYLGMLVGVSMMDLEVLVLKIQTKIKK